MRDAARDSATLPFPGPEFPEPRKGPATDVTETKAMTNEELRTLNKTRRIQQMFSYGSYAPPRLRTY